MLESLYNLVGEVDVWDTVLVNLGYSVNVWVHYFFWNHFKCLILVYYRLKLFSTLAEKHMTSLTSNCMCKLVPLGKQDNKEYGLQLWFDLVYACNNTSHLILECMFYSSLVSYSFYFFNNWNVHSISKEVVFKKVLLLW
mgnify:CR=1 FL=1